MRLSWSHKLKHDSSEKTTRCQSGYLLMSPHTHTHTHCRCSRRWFAVRGIRYKGIFARNPLCSRHRPIDEADISTPLAVDQRAANCLEEAVRSFTTMWSTCRLSRTNITFRHPLSIFRVVRCSLVHCFQTRITVELFRCTRASIANEMMKQK
ncbi:uncharacterized protein TNCV_2038061 [Trichonephila clavipes]|nr:uncharacterized protein TNCV_2038061 [Trichonephila clavipes]